jgi:cytochrome c-type biogenesis protein CcmH
MTAVHVLLAVLMALQPPSTPRGDSTPVAAQETELDRRAREVASSLRCPVCQGLSIQDSPSELALEMKAVVREQLASGRTPEEVRGYFIEKYGEWVLLEPRPAGFNLLVYALPVALVLGGGWFVLSFVRRHSVGTPPAQE